MWAKNGKHVRKVVMTIYKIIISIHWLSFVTDDDSFVDHQTSLQTAPCFCFCFCWVNDIESIV